MEKSIKTMLDFLKEYDLDSNVFSSISMTRYDMLFIGVNKEKLKSKFNFSTSWYLSILEKDVLISKLKFKGIDIIISVDK